MDKLFFTVITVTDELNAFTVFETLNARGVRLSTTDLLKNYLFSLIAREQVHQSEITNLENRWSDIVGLLGSERFPEFLRVYWNSRNKKIARFILLRIEEHLSGKSLDSESAGYGIEHVLPERPEDGWEQFDDRQRDDFTYRLGNFTLLQTKANRHLGNASFQKKRPILKTSEYGISRKLAEDYDTWTADKIQARQNWMAKQATSIWRIPF